MKLKPFQVYSAKWLMRRKFCILGHDPGLGKTAISICSVVGKAVVVGPRFLIGVWEEEIEKFAPGASYTVVENRFDLNRAIAMGVKFILMSYHRFVNLPVKRCVDRVFLLDEAHAFKSFTSKRTQAAINIIAKAKKVVAITGTPILNRPIEIFPLLSAFGVTKMNYWQFGFKYCGGKKTHFGFDFSHSSNEEELQKKISSVMLRFTKTQVAPELKPKIYKVIPLKLGKVPIELEYDLKHIYALPPDIAFETMSTALKIHAEMKFDMVLEYVEWRLGYDQKVVVFTHHRNEMSIPLFERLKKFSPVMVIGGMSHSEIKKCVNSFQTDPRCRIIIVSIMAGGVGLTLNAASRAIFAEAAWSPLVIEQAADRLHRLTTTEQVRIDVLTIQNSIDEYQIRRALEKLDTINQLVRESTMAKQAEQKPTLSERLGELLDDLDELLKDVEALEAATPEPEPEPETRRTRGGGKGKDEEQEDPPKGGRTRAASSANGKGNGKAKGPSFDDVRDASAKLIEEFVEGREIIDEILTDMGYDPSKHKISALDESEYGDFIKRVDKELSA